MKQVSVVGIAGGTASGKSTIVSYIKVKYLYIIFLST